MNILLINPPNCGRSIPEERYGIVSLKQIFRGEPLALEELAGNLLQHNVHIVDLKANPAGLDEILSGLRPDIVGITGVTCEANSMLKIASQVKKHCAPIVVVGGIQASNDPGFFNHQDVDFIVVGLGKKTFADLAALLEAGQYHDIILPGLIPTRPGQVIQRPLFCSSVGDLVEDKPPAYELVKKYRSHYVLEKLGVNMGFVASACGCTHRCSFCCITGQTGGKYLTKSIDAVVRDIKLLGDIPVIRLVDANTFGDIERAKNLCRALVRSELKKQYLADIRSDTVVRHPEMLREWKEAGLRAVIIGFEETSDESLSAMNKANKSSINTEAISILNDLGITIVGDFIISPDYDEGDFERLGIYLDQNRIDLPMITVMTPLPGTPLYQQQKNRIVNHNLDYYTLTNAVTKTRLNEKLFYTLYAELISSSHKNARI
ncbi:B12-binding domain-containing radical SAM protein [Desulforhopalus sp. IMCC35007]|uniref:B12-binding domain-containing radical SAM protein n=1 Tax=Desulforhopalus sp. IMCC35007 TaxID=2569543 RepID=UPI0010AE7447|nr:radical SAM protein [Desulforhopalus sp. IMCC35007]TKB10837.1 radical SAM protein [Desulforhopalus sp. IMCC35007]